MGRSQEPVSSHRCAGNSHLGPLDFIFCPKEAGRAGLPRDMGKLKEKRCDSGSGCVVRYIPEGKAVLPRKSSLGCSRLNEWASVTCSQRSVDHGGSWVAWVSSEASAWAGWRPQDPARRVGCSSGSLRPSGGYGGVLLTLRPSALHQALNGIAGRALGRWSGFLQAKGRTKVRKIDRNTWLLERGCWEGRKAPSPSGSLRPGFGDLLALTGPRVSKFM